MIVKNNKLIVIDNDDVLDGKFIVPEQLTFICRDSLLYCKNLTEIIYNGRSIKIKHIDGFSIELLSEFTIEDYKVYNGKVFDEDIIYYILEKEIIHQQDNDKVILDNLQPVIEVRYSNNNNPLNSTEITNIYNKLIYSCYNNAISVSCYSKEWLERIYRSSTIMSIEDDFTIYASMFSKRGV